MFWHIFGNKIDRLTLRARNAIRRGDLKAADAALEKIISIQDEALQQAANAAFCRGLCAEGDFRYNDAAQHYKRAHELGHGPEALDNHLRMIAIMRAK